MRGWLVLGGIAFAVWAAYRLSPIPECRDIAQVLDEGSAAFYGVGPRWDIFNIADCAIASEAQRRDWLSNAELFRANAIMLRENMAQPTRRRP
jgi:hypothetical protein